jgi:hypothetical protein
MLRNLEALVWEEKFMLQTITFKILGRVPTRMIINYLQKMEDLSVKNRKQRKK